jgi:hypothetical protein
VTDELRTWELGGVIVKFAAPAPLRVFAAPDAAPAVTETVKVVVVSAADDFTTNTAELVPPVAFVLQFNVTDVAIVVPFEANVPSPVACSRAGPAVNATSTGKRCEAYCPNFVRRVRNIEVSILDLPFRFGLLTAAPRNSGQLLSLGILSAGVNDCSNWIQVSARDNKE